MDYKVFSVSSANDSTAKSVACCIHNIHISVDTQSVFLVFKCMLFRHKVPCKTHTVESMLPKQMVLRCDI